MATVGVWLPNGILFDRQWSQIGNGKLGQAPLKPRSSHLGNVLRTGRLVSQKQTSGPRLPNSRTRSGAAG